MLPSSFQICTSPSVPPVAKDFPSELKLTSSSMAFFGCLNVLGLLGPRFPSTCQSLTLQSAAAVARVRLSGLKQRPLTGAPCTKVAISLPFSSQRCAVPSSDALANKLPSELNSMPSTQQVWPASVCSSLIVFRFHILMVWSSLHEARCSPLGWNRIPQTAAACSK